LKEQAILAGVEGCQKNMGDEPSQVALWTAVFRFCFPSGHLSGRAEESWRDFLFDLGSDPRAIRLVKK